MENEEERCEECESTEEGTCYYCAYNEWYNNQPESWGEIMVERDIVREMG